MINKQINYNISKRSKPIKNIIVHYTGNYSKTANAEGHYNYFNSGDRKSSADIFVDDMSTWRINDYKQFYTWAVGDNANYAGRKGKMNINSVHVEICVNGNLELAIKRSQEVVYFLMQDLNLTIDDVYRHYDCSGKICPPFLIDTVEWNKYKQGVINCMSKDYIQILKDKTTNPQGWIDVINYIESNPDKLGEMKILKYLKVLIEKLGNK